MIEKIWKSYKLADIAADVAMGPFGSNLKVDNFITSGIPVIRGLNLNYGGFQEKNFVFVTEEKAKSLKRSLAYPGDLVFTHRGTLGQVGIIPDDKYPYYLVSQSQMRLTVRKELVSPLFLYYFFISPVGQRELLKNSSQVGVPAIASPTKSLKDVSVSLPPLSEQERIASILSSFDDKIHLNIQMNKNLEAIAQSIFKEWFVNFRFPGFDGTLVDGLPDGWRYGKLGELIELKYGKALVENKREHGVYPVLGSNGIIGYHNKFLVPGPGIIVGRKGTAGKVTWVDSHFYPIDTAFYACDQLGVSDLHYHYYTLKSQPFDKISSDSAVPGLNRDEALRNKIILPSREIINDFNRTVKPLSDKMRSNLSNNQIITEIRDILLPRLITGRIMIA